MTDNNKKRQVFFSFHFGNDYSRVHQVRNMGILDGNELVSPNDWEEIKRQGDDAIRKWIDENMNLRSCVIVLIGEETYKRQWVKYEIKKAYDEGKGLLGIYIHNLKCMKEGKCSKGNNPFDYVTDNDSNKISSATHVKVYDPTIPSGEDNSYNTIESNLKDWIEGAIASSPNSTKNIDSSSDSADVFKEPVSITNPATPHLSTTLVDKCEYDFLTQENIEEIKGRYMDKDIQLIQDGDKVTEVITSVRFNKEWQDVIINSEGEFKIKILNEVGFDGILPKVMSANGKICDILNGLTPKKYKNKKYKYCHINGDCSFCFMKPEEASKRFPDGFNIIDFLDEIDNHLFYYAYVEKYGLQPWSGTKHDYKDAKSVLLKCCL